MPFSVTDSLDRYVAAVEDDRQPDGKWHPSSISSPCERRSIYEITGTPKSNPIDLRTKRVFRVGHIMHEFIQTAIEQDPTVSWFAPEVPISAPELNITGSADGLVEFSDGHMECLEFKTIRSTAFRYNDLPKEDHIVQLSLYMKVLREYGTTLADGTVILPMGDAMSRGRIVYVSKDDLQVAEYTVLWTEAKDREIMERLARLNSHRDAGTLPARLPVKGTKKHYLCGYCAFADTCWAPKEQA